MPLSAGKALYVSTYLAKLQEIAGNTDEDKDPNEVMRDLAEASADATIALIQSGLVSTVVITDPVTGAGTGTGAIA
jgi:hypothetical protein